MHFISEFTQLTQEKRRNMPAIAPDECGVYDEKKEGRVSDERKTRAN